MPKWSLAIEKTKQSKWPWKYFVFLHPAVASKRADVKVEPPPTSFVRQANSKLPTTFRSLMDGRWSPLRVFKGDEEWSASVHDRGHCASNMVVAAQAHTKHLDMTAPSKQTAEMIQIKCKSILNKGWEYWYNTNSNTSADSKLHTYSNTCMQCLHF